MGLAFLQYSILLESLKEISPWHMKNNKCDSCQEIFFSELTKPLPCQNSSQNCIFCLILTSFSSAYVGKQEDSGKLQLPLEIFLFFPPTPWPPKGAEGRRRAGRMFSTGVDEQRETHPSVPLWDNSCSAATGPREDRNNVFVANCSALASDPAESVLAAIDTRSNGLFLLL